MCHNDIKRAEKERRMIKTGKQNIKQKELKHKQDKSILFSIIYVNYKRSKIKRIQSFCLKQARIKRSTVTYTFNSRSRRQSSTGKMFPKGETLKTIGIQRSR